MSTLRGKRAWNPNLLHFGQVLKPVASKQDIVSSSTPLVLPSDCNWSLCLLLDSMLSVSIRLQVCSAAVYSISDLAKLEGPKPTHFQADKQHSYMNGVLGYLSRFQISTLSNSAQLAFLSTLRTRVNIRKFGTSGTLPPPPTGQWHCCGQWHRLVGRGVGTVWHTMLDCTPSSASPGLLF